jgi:hypothetical protein
MKANSETGHSQVGLFCLGEELKKLNKKVSTGGNQLRHAL